MRTDTTWDVRVTFQMQMTTTIDASTQIVGGRLHSKFAATNVQGTIVGPVSTSISILPALCVDCLAGWLRVPVSG